jgi:hypothetical protein
MEGQGPHPRSLRRRVAEKPVSHTTEAPAEGRWRESADFSRGSRRVRTPPRTGRGGRLGGTVLLVAAMIAW